jgi:hypothetical protein
MSSLTSATRLDEKLNALRADRTRLTVDVEKVPARAPILSPILR